MAEILQLFCHLPQVPEIRRIQLTQEDLQLPARGQRVANLQQLPRLKDSLHAPNLLQQFPDIPQAGKRYSDTLIQQLS